MAKADALANGRKVTINAGAYEGHVATVLDNKPIPDDGDDRGSGDEFRRRILIRIDDVFDVNDQPYETWILPRLVDLLINEEERAALAHTPVRVDTVKQPEFITDPMDPVFDRYRPNESVVRKYISRIVEGGYSDLDFFLGQRDQRDEDGFSPNIALVGETQSGKTMLVRVLACLMAERDGMPKPYPVITINGSAGITAYDIYGRTQAVLIDGKETLVWMEGPAGIAARIKGCILYMDEWNAVPAKHGVGVHGMLDDRHQFTNYQKAVPDGHGGYVPEVVDVDPMCWIIATINPTGYKGTGTMSEATSNRFSWFSWDYDEATEQRLIPSPTVRTLGDKLRFARTMRQVTIPIGTSVLMRFCHNCQTFGVPNAVWSLMALFPPVERDRVKAIIEEGGNILGLLMSEYPTPRFTPTFTGGATPPLAPTWGGPTI